MNDIGRPGADTVSALVRQSWVLLFARRFDAALAAASRASKLAPNRLAAELNIAHALMFLGRSEEALAIHRRNIGRRLPVFNNRLWQGVETDNFRRLREADV
ncbi:unnamed protein product, partial [Phaeothamnion confervicola]